MYKYTIWKYQYNHKHVTYVRTCSSKIEHSNEGKQRVSLVNFHYAYTAVIQ